jgi:membrane-associated phospholipid phosphatase
MMRFYQKFIICVLLLVYGSRLNAQNLDLKLLEHINGPAAPADQAWRTVSTSTVFFVAITPVSMLATGFFTHNDQLTQKSIATAGSIVIAGGTVLILKNLVKRERPYIAHPDLITGKASDTDYSFPSGHTATAFATATSLSLSFPKWYVIAPSFTYAAAVGYSRMYLGVHYPSDVLTGALIGTGSAFLSFELQRLFLKK